ncbi:hypothetical protein [Variovorax sp. LjRoot290]|uniref:hypothetical protein n=1 Tax=Variovorax sp. LjRoot290 TaxID=3342316 RepID=UPI003F513B21
MSKLRIFMAEDSAAARVRLTEDLSHCADLAIVGCADTELGALTWLVEHPHGWDLAIVDLASPVSFRTCRSAPRTQTPRRCASRT